MKQNAVLGTLSSPSGMKSTSTKLQDHYDSDREATEKDPLLISSQNSYCSSSSASTIRERRPALSLKTSNSSSNLQHRKSRSSSPLMQSVEESHSVEGERNNSPRSYDHETGGPSSYEIYNESNDNMRSMRSMRSLRTARSQQASKEIYRASFSDRDRYFVGTEKMHDYYNERAKSIFSEQNQREEPLVETSPEVLNIRKRALKVFEPLTYTWVRLQS